MNSKDYTGEPPSSWTSHSRGIQLYEQSAMARGVTPQDLSVAGEATFTGRARPSKDTGQENLVRRPIQIVTRF